MSKRGFALPLVLFGIVILAVVFAGGYLMGASQKSPSSSNSPDSSVAPTPAELSDWKIYSDQNNVFFVKHPSNFLQTKDTGGFPAFPSWKDAGVLHTTQEWNEPGTPEDVSLQFMIIPKKPEVSLEVFVAEILRMNAAGVGFNNDEPEVPVDVKGTVIVDGRSALWYEGNLGPAVYHAEVYIPKDDEWVVRVEIFSGGEWTDLPEKQKVVAKQILSTFRFTE